MREEVTLSARPWANPASADVDAHPSPSPFRSLPPATAHGRPLNGFPRPGATRTDPEAFADELDAEALAQPALRHPWLFCVKKRVYPDMPRAMRDFAWQYHAYSSAFPSYLRCAIRKLQLPRHRALLEENLREEQGELGLAERCQLRRAGLDPACVDGIPHPKLYRAFCGSLDLTEEELARPTREARLWQKEFLAFLEDASLPAVLGALGPGTENIVSPIYGALLVALRALPNAERIDLRFIVLHCNLDDQHAQDLRVVAQAFMSTESDRREMRSGMLKALALREQFFTHLHHRALEENPGPCR